MKQPIELNETNTLTVNPARVNKIGRLLIQLGKITPEDIDKIVEVQDAEGLLFGDAALKLGLINKSDVQQVIAMQFNYHYLQAGQGDFSKELIAAYEPFSEQVESYRALRSQLMMRWFKDGNKTLALVSPNHKEGLSFLAANLAVVFAQLGARTLLIDANMRDPKQQTIFNIQQSPGLSDMIVGRVGIGAIKKISDIQDLSVLSAGTPPPNPQELLGRASFNYLMKIASEYYDVVLVDCPPATRFADSQSIIEKCRGALVVSKLNQTKLAEITEVKNQVEMTDATVVGVVVNEF